VDNLVPLQASEGAQWIGRVTSGGPERAISAELVRWKKPWGNWRDWSIGVTFAYLEDIVKRL
jgi:hypothetical protein